MPSLKSLRLRIGSVRSTQKITMAMKMVAASKLRRVQKGAEEARPYAAHIRRIVSVLAAGIPGEIAPPLLSGTGREDTCLLLVMTSNRGLCGGFNSLIVRQARQDARNMLAAGKKVRIICVGRKGLDNLSRDLGHLIFRSRDSCQAHHLVHDEAGGIRNELMDLYAEGGFDVCRIYYSRFRSVISQLPTSVRIIPAEVDDDPEESEVPPTPVFGFEPEDKEEILARLLPEYLRSQICQALLENLASEEGARMTAMDSATRNAGEVIRRLTLSYNRARQAAITREIIEIISGAEAL